MKRLIYAEDVKEQIDEWLEVVGTACVGKGLSYYYELLGCIEDAPTVEAAPVVHGEWIRVPSSDMMTGAAYKCSECGKLRFGSYLPNFCQHCGADMRKEVAE